MKSIISKVIILVIIIGIFLIVYPNIEFRKNNKLYKFTYSEDWSEFEENMCYNESYSYNNKRDISIYSWDIKKFLFFKVLVLDYKKGNVCNTEYLLEEEYIHRVISEADFISNEKNIDLKKLIEGKKAIVGNKRYFGNDYETFIEYKLDGEYKEMYIFYNDDLLIIQIGLSDEGPKFIAYK